jgi:hypothetical protein
MAGEAVGLINMNTCQQMLDEGRREKPFVRPMRALRPYLRASH